MQGFAKAAGAHHWCGSHILPVNNKIGEVHTHTHTHEAGRERRFERFSKARRPLPETNRLMLETEAV